MTQHRLWYNKPAFEWTDALAIGNGRLGAMIFGNTHNETLQLNEESVWAGKQLDRRNPGALEALPKIRELIFEGNTEAAETLGDAHMMGIPMEIESYQPLADLKLHFRNSNSCFGDMPRYWSEDISKLPPYLR